jgi:CubicO group peptidase (beta-lactamase class C family)
MSEIVATTVSLNKLSESTYRKLNSRVEAAVRARIAPSTAIAVFHKDMPILNSAWGWTDPETKNSPLHTAGLFDLASLTKLYTTMAFFTLVTDEKVSLHGRLVDVIPEFGKVSPRPIDGGQDPFTKEPLPVDAAFKGQKVNPREVTFFQLLTHTSGLPAWRDVFSVAPAPAEPPQTEKVERAERWSKALERLYEFNFVGFPETGVRYSDVGMMLLGEVVSRLHGNSGKLDEAIKQRVLRDKLRDTLFNPLYNRIPRHEIAPTEMDVTWRKRRIWGEVHDENASGVGGVSGHAGLFATAQDVALFGNFYLNHAERMLKIDPELAIAATELQAQTEDVRRGLGWALKSEKGAMAGDRFHPTSYGHSGFTGTTLWIDPQANLVVALLTNRVWGGRDDVDSIHQLRRDVHDIIHEGLVS